MKTHLECSLQIIRLNLLKSDPRRNESIPSTLLHEKCCGDLTRFSIAI